MLKGSRYEYSTERYKDFMDVKAKLNESLIQDETYRHLDENRFRFVENEYETYTIVVLVPNTKYFRARVNVLDELGFVYRRGVNSLD